MITLASSRATSQRITSPSGFVAAPCRCTTLRTAGEPQSSSSAWCATSSGRDDPQVDHDLSGVGRSDAPALRTCSGISLFS